MVYGHLPMHLMNYNVNYVVLILVFGFVSVMVFCALEIHNPYSINHTPLSKSAAKLLGFERVEKERFSTPRNS